MVSLAQLWLPIVVSAVFVFIASSLVHMVFKWHNSDYRKLANEDDVRAVIRAGNATQGQYIIPHCLDHKELAGPEMQQKFAEGPVGVLMLRPAHKPSMGPALAQWFVLNLAIAIIAAYLASRLVPIGASFLAVCRLVGAVVFVAYAGGSVASAIWMGKPWGSAAKEVLDAAIYAVVAAVAFGWLWPR